ncbi:iron-containing alcohol dehydrogenase [Gordonibacillus kamchatkensis]|nr:iron-containing alcohol dehydrogenase [Paenibacillus sp. VKM B-2647]
MTRRGLQLCTDNTEAIAAGTPEGLRKLMEGLVLSGIAMLLIGHSRPASGAEHHLSHYWEMRLLQQRRRALLHGAKVGAAAVLMAAAYDALRRLPPQEALARAAAAAAAPGDDAARIRAAYGPLADAVLRENGSGGDAAAAAQARARELAALRARWPALQAAAAEVWFGYFCYYYDGEIFSIKWNCNGYNRWHTVYGDNYQ